MGQPLDSTRETRFPDRPEESARRRQMDLRELEDAIVWLQEQNAEKDSTILLLNAQIDALSSRIDILESSQ